MPDRSAMIDHLRIKADWLDGRDAPIGVTGTIEREAANALEALQADVRELRDGIERLERELLDKADHYARTAEVSGSPCDDYASGAMDEAAKMVRSIFPPAPAAGEGGKQG